MSLLVTVAFAVPAGATTEVVTNADEAAATNSSSRGVVRIGALLFALGSIATYAAAGTRRNPVRDVDPDGRDL